MKPDQLTAEVTVDCLEGAVVIATAKRFFMRTEANNWGLRRPGRAAMERRLAHRLGLFSDLVAARSGLSPTHLPTATNEAFCTTFSIRRPALNHDQRITKGVARLWFRISEADDAAN